MPQFVKDKRGVSPVLAVILMVALTVILSGIVAMAMLDMAVIPELKIVGIMPNRVDVNHVNFVITSITPIGTNMTKLKGTGGIDITDSSKLEIGDTFQNTAYIPPGTEVVLTATFGDGTSQVIFASKV